MLAIYIPMSTASGAIRTIFSCWKQRHGMVYCSKLFNTASLLSREKVRGLMWITKTFVSRFIECHLLVSLALVCVRVQKEAICIKSLWNLRSRCKWPDFFSTFLSETELTCSFKYWGAWIFNELIFCLVLISQGCLFRPMPAFIFHILLLVFIDLSILFLNHLNPAFVSNVMVICH